MTEEKEIKQEPKKDSYELVEVPTQMGIAIQTPTGDVITSDRALVELLNEVKEIKEALTGR